MFRAIGSREHQNGAQILSSPLHPIFATRKAPLPDFARSRLDRNAPPRCRRAGDKMDTGVAAKIQDIDDTPTLPMTGAAYLPGVGL